MLKLTGLKKINEKNVYVKGIRVALSIYLTPLGSINLDIHYLESNSNEEVAREYISVERNSLVYDEAITDPYDQMLNAIEDLLIANYFVGDGLSAEKISVPEVVA